MLRGRRQLRRIERSSPQLGTLRGAESVTGTQEFEEFSWLVTVFVSRSAPSSVDDAPWRLAADEGAALKCHHLGCWGVPVRHCVR